MYGFVVLCPVLVTYLYHWYWWISLIDLPISFRVTSQALGQSYDCPSAYEGTLMNINKTVTKPQQNTTLRTKDIHICCKYHWWIITLSAWWHHQMETFFALLALCAGNSPFIGEFPSQRPVMQSFDVFFDMRLNKPLSKPSWCWWFETRRAH